MKSNFYLFHAKAELVALFPRVINLINTSSSTDSLEAKMRGLLYPNSIIKSARAYFYLLKKYSMHTLSNISVRSSQKFLVLSSLESQISLIEEVFNDNGKILADKEKAPILQVFRTQLLDVHVSLKFTVNSRRFYFNASMDHHNHAPSLRITKSVCSVDSKGENIGLPSTKSYHVQAERKNGQAEEGIQWYQDTATREFSVFMGFNAGLEIDLLTVTRHLRNEGMRAYTLSEVLGPRMDSFSAALKSGEPEKASLEYGEARMSFISNKKPPLCTKESFMISDKDAFDAIDERKTPSLDFSNLWGAIHKFHREISTIWMTPVPGVQSLKLNKTTFVIHVGDVRNHMSILRRLKRLGFSGVILATCLDPRVGLLEPLTQAFIVGGLDGAKDIARDLTSEGNLIESQNLSGKDDDLKKYLLAKILAKQEA